MIRAWLPFAFDLLCVLFGLVFFWSTVVVIIGLLKTCGGIRLRRRNCGSPF